MTSHVGTLEHRTNSSVPTHDGVRIIQNALKYSKSLATGLTVQSVTMTSDVFVMTLKI